MRYVCETCGFVYDEREGDIESDIEPGTLFEELPEDYQCPMCGSGKEQFYEEEN